MQECLLLQDARTVHDPVMHEQLDGLETPKPMQPGRNDRLTSRPRVEARQDHQGGTE